MILTTRISFKDFWEYIVKEEISKDIGRKEMARYEGIAEKNILPELGSYEMKDISTADIDRLIDVLKRRCSTSAMHKIRALLFRIFHLAVMKGVRPDNPVENAKKIRTIRTAGCRYSEDDCVDLLKSFQKTELAGALTFQFLTGLSKAEVYGLRAGGIDLQNNTIMIDQFYVIDENGCELISDKSSSFRKRRIEIPACAINVLIRELISREKKRARAGTEWNNNNDLVFTDPDGRPVTLTRTASALRKIRKMCDYGGSRSLQDNFGVMAVALGVSTADLHEYLGHKSFETAARYARSKEPGNKCDLSDQ